VQKQDVGICYECMTKNNDSSKKQVYQCGLCNKWFCELHSKPKLPYFVDWETIFDIQGNPEIKALFYSEYRRRNGHADFIYLRQTIESLKNEKKFQNELIQQAIDKMVEANWKRGNTTPIDNALEASALEVEKGMTETTENIYGQRFIIPKEIYACPEYREYLNHARTKESVKVILDEYYKKYSKKERAGHALIYYLEKEQQSQMKQIAKRKKDREKKIDKMKWWQGDNEIEKIYEDKRFRKRIEKCQTIEERDSIINEYNKTHLEPENKKRHWWQ